MEKAMICFGILLFIPLAVVGQFTPCELVNYALSRELNLSNKTVAVYYSTIDLVATRKDLIKIKADFISHKHVSESNFLLATACMPAKKLTKRIGRNTILLSNPILNSTDSTALLGITFGNVLTFDLYSYRSKSWNYVKSLYMELSD